MQRTFSREYGFLLGCWAFFAVLGFVLAACGGLADGAVSRAVIDAALTACEAMVAAALGILAIRYAWKPYLAAYAAVLVWYLGQYCFLGMPQALRPMNSAPAWVVIGTALMGLVLLALGGMVQYLLAKGLYRLLRAREGTVAIALVVIDFVLYIVRALLEQADMAAALGQALETALLGGVAYALLYVCIRRWWDKPAVAGRPDEKGASR